MDNERIEEETYLCSHCGKNWVVGKHSMCEECKMKAREEYATWLYDQIKKGEETPLSNSSVIFYFKECAKRKDMATSQFYISAAFLVEELDTADDREIALRIKLEEYESDWIPIDYGEADSGKGCFDGESYVFKVSKNCVLIASYHDARGFIAIDWERDKWSYLDIKPTHYRPIPEGWLK